MAETTLKDIYPLILEKLEAIELCLDERKEEVKAHLTRNSETLESRDSLLAELKSTRTSFELLRDEIDELHELTIALFKERRK